MEIRSRRSGSLNSCSDAADAADAERTEPDRSTTSRRRSSEQDKYDDVNIFFFNYSVCVCVYWQNVHYDGCMDGCMDG